MEVAVELGRLTIHDDQLPKTELYIACSWRHVDNQHIKITRRFPPVHVEQQLKQYRVQDVS